MSTDSTKQGKIKTCPNCGATLKSFTGKCHECGHELSSIEGNSTVKDLQKLLDAIDKDPAYQKKGGFLSDDPRIEKKEEIILNFPIPNTKDDFIELITLCNTQVNMEDNDLYSAWEAKSKQLISKSNLLFKNDNDVKTAISDLEKSFKKNKKEGKKAGWTAFFIFILIFAALGVGIWLVDESKDAKNYTQTQIELMNALPTPDTDNYMDCYRQFSQIQWTEKTDGDWENGYNAFTSARDSYAQALILAFKAAGVNDADIPQILKSTPLEEANSVESTSKNMESETQDNKEEDITQLPLEEQIEIYSNNLCEQIDSLPMPDKENYKECIREFSKIVWTKNFDYKEAGISESKAKEGYAKKKVAYAQMIGMAMEEAGVENIPSDYKYPSEYDYK